MNRKEIVEALKLEDFSPIYIEADKIRRENKGNDVFIRAIIEFSNVCKRQCVYCGINRGHKGISRYRMTKEEIIETAKEAVSAGYRTIVLQSGEDDFFTDNKGEKLGEIVREIKRLGQTPPAVTLSCGELSYETLAHLKECGADRYLLRHETADPEIYDRLHPCGSLAERVSCLRDIKELGYETGSGFMVGLPGQTCETLADDLLLLRELGCDMAGIGPFISHPDTALADCPDGSTEMTKRTVAIARILLPKANLPVTTALGVLSSEERREAFSCGANVIMRKVTPDEYKEAYQIYPAKLQKTQVKKDRKDLEEMIRELGRRPV